MTDLPLIDARTHLRADCSRCAGLCCVAPAFAASADFAIDKPAGVACPNLQADFRCGIHAQLRERGFPGCTVFDCFGAGQRITQETFGGRSWREDPDLAATQFAVLPIVRQLHEASGTWSRRRRWLPAPGCGRSGRRPSGWPAARRPS
jgi:hypothetical protein